MSIFDCVSEFQKDILLYKTKDRPHHMLLFDQKNIRVSSSYKKKPVFLLKIDIQACVTGEMPGSEF